VKRDKSSQTSLTKWLRTTQATRDRKWIYTLVAWVIENKDKDTDDINRHINTIWHHNQGYFKKYAKNDKKYWQEYYKKNREKWKKSNKRSELKKKTIWTLYQHNKLSEHSTEVIREELDKLKGYKK